MTGPIDRLRAADPAAGLGPQPDERAEADLRLLLAEPRTAAAPVVPRDRRRVAPILVTAVVAIAVIALTAAVLAFVHPRTDVGGAGPTTGPSLGAGSCHPALVLPFQCGTYRSTYGGKSITGDFGGPAKDRLSISFTAQNGALLLTARTQHCFGETVLVRAESARLVRMGTPVYDAAGCVGRGVNMKSWAAAFLSGPLDLLATDGPYFGTGNSSVFFEYLGAAPIGEQQLPRTEQNCVPAHVLPFDCSTSTSTGGTGTLAFLAGSPYRLVFMRANGELTLGLRGGCNGASASLQVDGSTIVAMEGATTLIGCADDRATHDHALSAFFQGSLSYARTGDTITFTKGASSATFSR